MACFRVATISIDTTKLLCDNLSRNSRPIVRPDMNGNEIPLSLKSRSINSCVDVSRYRKADNSFHFYTAAISHLCLRYSSLPQVQVSNLTCHRLCCVSTQNGSLHSVAHVIFLSPHSTDKTCSCINY